MSLHRGLGVWFSILGLEIFLAKNGLGGFLGPKWKVFHHGTLREHFQGAVIAFGSQPDSEIRVERGVKNQSFFCPKNMQYVTRVDEKLTSVKNWVHTCPKTCQKLFLSTFLSVKMGHFCRFLSSFAQKWRQLKLGNSCAGFVGVRGLTRVLRSGSHWFRPRKSFPFWEMTKTPHRVINRRMVNNSVTKPPIKILRPLFTLQLLILPTRNPFHSPKS